MDGYPLRMPGQEAIWRGVDTRAKTVMVTLGADSADNDLVRQALTGDIGSFKTLVERYQRRAYVYARSMVHNQDDAYDLSQEAFVRVYRHLRRFNPAYPFKVWFFHILANLCRNHLRKSKVRDMVNSPDESEPSERAAERDNPEMAIEKIQLQGQVREAIGRLPEKFKEIIILSHFQEMSYDEIAQVLGIPRGSVMSRLYYARLKLREILEKMGVEL